MFRLVASLLFLAVVAAAFIVFNGGEEAQQSKQVPTEHQVPQQQPAPQQGNKQFNF